MKWLELLVVFILGALVWFAVQRHFGEERLEMKYVIGFFGGLAFALWRVLSRKR